jgi:hypothetical protein
VKIVPIWRAELDQLHEEVNDMRRLLAQLVVRLPDRKPRRRRIGNVTLPPGVTAVELEPADGGDAASPPAPPAVEDDPPYADDFDSEGHVKPRQVERVELPPPPGDAS